MTTSNSSLLAKIIEEQVVTVSTVNNDPYLGSHIIVTHKGNATQIPFYDNNSGISRSN